MSEAIVVEPNTTSQWHKLVTEAQHAAQVDLGEDLESYLVFLLMRFAGDAHIVSRVLAQDYLEGLGSAGHVRHERLRDVGDHCLLFSGLFPRRAARRRVRISYYVNLGRSAYTQLAGHAQSGLARLYGDLAAGFVAVMDTMHAMRNLDDGGAGREPLLDPISAAQLWSDTGSRQALAALGAATGGMPCLAPVNLSSKPH